MPYSLAVSADFEKEYKSLTKKNPELSKAISKKLGQILLEPQRFKPLRAPFAGLRRVHILRNFVLIYSIDAPSKTVTLLRLAHHDGVYADRPV